VISKEKSFYLLEDIRDMLPYKLIKDLFIESFIGLHGFGSRGYQYFWRVRVLYNIIMLTQQAQVNAGTVLLLLSFR
jgi:hypothetical protein